MEKDLAIKRAAQEIKRWGTPELVADLAASSESEVMKQAARLLLSEGGGATRHEITCDLDEDCTCKENE